MRLILMLSEIRVFRRGDDSKLVETTYKAKRGLVYTEDPVLMLFDGRDTLAIPFWFYNEEYFFLEVELVSFGYNPNRLN